MIDDKNLFDQPKNNKFQTYENIRKIALVKGDDYATGCKQQELDFDSRAIQEINFTANLDRVGNTTMFSIIEEAK